MSRTFNADDLIRLPRRFYQDHFERALDTPDAVKATAAHVWVKAGDPANAELLDDALFYADPAGPDACPRGLIASAAATVAAFSAYWQLGASK